MEIDVVHESSTAFATLHGRFDVHGVPDFDQQIVDHVTAERPNVVIDLADVEFMDSSALASLVRALKRSMTHGGLLVLVAVSTPARIILELTRLNEVFAQADNLDGARQQLLTNS
jgi:anti-sigma B factor antagonist